MPRVQDFDLCRPDSAVDGDLGAELGSKSAPYLVGLDRQDMGAQAGRRGDDLQTHGASGEDEGALAGLERGLVVHGVQAIGERFQEHGAVEGQILGQPERPRRPGDRLDRDHRKLGIAAIGVAVDALAQAPAGDAGAERGDAPDPLMAGIEGVVAVVHADLVFARIRGADAAGLDLDQQLAGRRCRNGNPLQAHVADAMQPRDLHRTLGHRSSISLASWPSSCM